MMCPNCKAKTGIKPIGWAYETHDTPPGKVTIGTPPKVFFHKCGSCDFIFKISQEEQIEADKIVASDGHDNFKPDILEPIDKAVKAISKANPALNVWRFNRIIGYQVRGSHFARYYDATHTEDDKIVDAVNEQIRRESK